MKVLVRVKKVTTITKAKAKTHRQVARLVGAFLLTYCVFACLVTMIQFGLAIWLNALYVTGRDEGLDLNTPLKNFTGTESAIAFTDLYPMPVVDKEDTEEVNLNTIKQLASSLFVSAIIFSFLTIPQFIGGLFLMRSTESERHPKEAYSLVRTHQGIQLGVCAMELILMVMLSISLFIWPILLFSWYFVGCWIMLFLIIFRMRTWKEVQKFEMELLENKMTAEWIEAGQPRPRYKLVVLRATPNAGNKLEETKKEGMIMANEKNLGHVKIDLSKMCQDQN